MSKKKSNKENVVSIFVLCSLCSFWIAASQVSLNPFAKGWRFLGPDGFLAAFENKTINARIFARGPMDAPVNVCFVDVDAESIASLGNFPWNREYFAMALDALFKYGGIKAVGFDFVFSMAGIPALGRAEAEEGSKKLGQSVHRNKNVVLAASFSSGGQFPFLFEQDHSKAKNETPETPAFPIVGPTWGHIGLIDILGGDVRYVPFFAKTPNHTYLPLSLRLALLHWGLTDSALSIQKESLVVTGQDGEVKARIPLIMGQLVEPNWFGGWMEKDHHASIVHVMAFGQAMNSGTEEEKMLARKFFAPFKDSVVLIGPVDLLLKDVGITPVSGNSQVPLVSVHGNLFKTLTSGKFIHRPPVWINCVLILLLGFGASSFCLVPQRYSSFAKFFGSLLVLGYIGAAFFVFAKYGLIIPLVAPIGAAASCTFSGALIHLSNERKQKRRITGMFGTYLSPTLVEKMVDSGEEPKLGGIDAEITAFFSDVQGFSGFSELLTPQQLVSLMNEYLSAMTDILMEQGCYVDKYIGDAIVGIFNSPVALENHAYKACVTTQLMHARLAELRLKWLGEGNKWPPFVSRMQMRIGMNTGRATVGNMGSAKRFNYTMMGDSVNLAARCESGAKSYGVYTMVTGETKHAAEAAGDDCVFRFLDKIIVKGRSEPAEMYEVVCLRKDLTEEVARCLALYAEGLEHYRSQRWDAALVSFGVASAIEPNRPEANPQSSLTPSLVMLERTRHLMANPPSADWDGVFVMINK